MEHGQRNCMLNRLLTLKRELYKSCRHVYKSFFLGFFKELTQLLKKDMVLPLLLTSV